VHTSDGHLDGNDEGWLVAAGTPGNKRFGQLLKGLRIRSDLTADQLASQAGVHVSFVRGIERGAQAPSVAKAQALLSCLTAQESIEWLPNGPPDLRIVDDHQGVTAFHFKAEVHGQNRRKSAVDVSALQAGLLMAIADKQGEQIAATSPDERIGRIVRMLPDAPEYTLVVIEQLLTIKGQNPQTLDV
jgi:transcriptional regulator with XRE-family HTH domain